MSWDKVASVKSAAPRAAQLDVRSRRESGFGRLGRGDCLLQRTLRPHLRVAAKSNMLEFRYIDTAIRQRQWVRIVSTESAYDRFVTFLDELNWFGRACPGNES
jgi:hypothetical protein